MHLLKDEQACFRLELQMESRKESNKNMETLNDLN